MYYIFYDFYLLSVRPSAHILYQDSWEAQVLKSNTKKDYSKCERKTADCLPQAEPKGMGFSLHA